MAKKTVEEVEVLSTAPLMGPSGPIGVLLETTSHEYVLLKGEAVIHLLTQQPASRPKRKAAVAVVQTNGSGNGNKRAGTCTLCKPPKPFTQRGNAISHVRSVHGKKGSAALRFVK